MRVLVVCAMIFLCNVWITGAKPYYRDPTITPKTCGAALTKRVMQICQNAGGFNEYSRKRGECQLSHVTSISFIQKTFMTHFHFHSK